MIPLNDLCRDHIDIQDALESAVLGVLRSGKYINGPQVSEFERNFSSFLCDDEKYANSVQTIGVSSGTDALLLSLMALGIGPGDEVIVPSFSFGAPAEVVKRVGATLRFADVSTTSFNLDPNSVQRVATPSTKAVIAVHLFGQCAPMNALRELCDKNNWFLIEDAAQAIGAKHHRQPAGTLGDVGCFSFYPTKNIGACGDAGAITTEDSALADRIKLIRNHGYEKKYQHQVIGGNFRLDEMQAAILNVKMPFLQTYNDRRREIATLFSEQIQNVLPPKTEPENHHVFHRYVIQTENRSELSKCLTDQNISNENYYPTPLHSQACFQAPATLPTTERLCEVSLALPLFPSMTMEEVEKIVNFVNK